MREYKRLTNNNSDEYDTRVDFCTGCYSYKYGFCDNPDGECSNFTRFCEMYNRLTELEDKIEAGTLMEFPVKAGDTVWFITEIEPTSWIVKTVEIHKDNYILRCGHEGNDDYAAMLSKYLGVWWFLTREGAEARLKEMEGKNANT